MKFFLAYPERAALAILAAEPTRFEIIATKSVLGRAGAAADAGFNLPNYPNVVRRTMERSLPHRYSLAGMNTAKRLWARAAARYIEPADSVFAFPGAALELFERAKGLKVLHAVDAHPLAHNESLRRAQGDPAEHYSRNWTARISAELSLADVVLAPSNRTASQMIENGVDAARVKVIPYGVDSELFKPIEVPRKSDRPIVLYVGQFSSRKGVSVLLQAARDVHIELWLVGNAFSPELKSLSTDGNLRVLKPQGHAELVHIYNSADAFFIPTAEDACSLVAFEAAASGLPIYSTVHNGAMEMLPSEAERSLGEGTRSEVSRRLREVGPLTYEMRLANARSAFSFGMTDWREYARKVLVEI